MTDAASALLLREFARSRNERVFRRLYDAVAPGMLGLAVRLAGGDRNLAEDVVQESWLRIIDRLDRFDQSGSVQRWCNGFVAHCWSERRRSAWREDVHEPAFFSSVPDEDRADWSDLDRVLQAVYALPEGYRTILVLHDIEGFTHAEIADRLSVQEGTSKSQLARARAQVRKLLGAANDDAHERRANAGRTR